jgi:hypothetical protein
MKWYEVRTEKNDQVHTIADGIADTLTEAVLIAHSAAIGFSGPIFVERWTNETPDGFTSPDKTFKPIIIQE